MRIQREVFQFSGHESVEVNDRVHLPPSKERPTRKLRRSATFDDILESVYAFVNRLQPARLVNICESTRNPDRIGDNLIHVWTVWYWDD